VVDTVRLLVALVGEQTGTVLVEQGQRVKEITVAMETIMADTSNTPQAVVAVRVTLEEADRAAAEAHEVVQEALEDPLRLRVRQ
jgi:hypothetical protein